MDMTASAQDIHDLVEAFASREGTELAHMKELWQARSFTFIHEARPKDVTPLFFMQALYSAALSHVVGENLLTWKLGGLYVLYTLYETQLFEPRFKIYLSLEDLEKLQFLVRELKRRGYTVALKVVHAMLQNKVFMFGCVAVNQGSIAAACDKLAAQAASRLQHARIRLLSNVPIQQHLLGNLAMEFSLDDVKNLGRDYSAAKHHVFSGIGSMESGAVMATLAEEEGTLGDELKDVAEAWESRRKSFVPREPIPCPEEVPPMSQKRKRTRGQPQGHLVPDGEEVIRDAVCQRTEDEVLADEIVGLLEQDQ